MVFVNKGDKEFGGWGCFPFILKVNQTCRDFPFLVSLLPFLIPFLSLFVNQMAPDLWFLVWTMYLH